MTAIVMNTIVNPFRGFGRGFNKWCEVVGYSRAAAHLASLGYYKEAKHCMMQVKALRSN